jgi:hypothetical protein
MPTPTAPQPATPTAPQLRTRPPTGAVPAPFVLVAGEEFAGKTHTAMQLTTSPRVGQCYALDLGEGALDEYGQLAGANFLLVDHDGTYVDILGQVTAVRAAAQADRDAGKPPVVFIIDTGSDLWSGLSMWVDSLARRRRKNLALLAEDPNAEIDVTVDLWNLATRRWRRIMALLLTFPGIVVMTARAGDTVDMRTGRPADGPKVWKVEGQKGLMYDASVVLRLDRGARPVIVGMRSVRAGIRPGEDRARKIAGDHDTDLLEHLVFDVMGYDPATSPVRDIRSVTGGDLLPEERAELNGGAPDQPAATRAMTDQEAAYAVGQLTAALALPAPAERVAALRTLDAEAKRHGVHMHGVTVRDAEDKEVDLREWFILEGTAAAVAAEEDELAALGEDTPASLVAPSGQQGEGPPAPDHPSTEELDAARARTAQAQRDAQQDARPPAVAPTSPPAAAGPRLDVLRECSARATLYDHPLPVYLRALYGRMDPPLPFVEGDQAQQEQALTRIPTELLVKVAVQGRRQYIAAKVREVLGDEELARRFDADPRLHRLSPGLVDEDFIRRMCELEGVAYAEPLPPLEDAA